MPNNEWGDFQTPRELADQVVATLGEKRWPRVLEPTCGTGSFLAAVEALEPSERLGIEVQAAYANQARDTGARVVERSVFDVNLGLDLDWHEEGQLLVVGNPPWVTSAELGAQTSSNVPAKRNLRGLRGIDALTGASNFDIAEFIWLKIILELADDKPTIALLCKTQVARNVFEYCHRENLAISQATIRRIDAKKWFGASVDACLLTLVVGEKPDWRCRVYADLDSSDPTTVIGFAAGRLVADLDAYERAAIVEGHCPWDWRQGVKHDAVRVMELVADDEGLLHNRLGEVVAVESNWVYPLLNATDLHRGRLDPGKSVIVTQRTLADDTNELASEAPRLWEYLNRHGPLLDGRKSSIYRQRSRFAMFGIGEYTFAPWKVAVSGLHTPAQFSLLGMVDARPILVDDTCYFLAFEDGVQAAIACALLQLGAVREFLLSVSFSDAKRPITKKVLQRIDLAALSSNSDLLTVADSATEILGERVDLANVRLFTERLSSERLPLGA